MVTAQLFRLRLQANKRAAYLLISTRGSAYRRRKNSRGQDRKPYERGKKDLEGMLWVLRFAETEYTSSASRYSSVQKGTRA